MTLFLWLMDVKTGAAHAAGAAPGLATRGRTVAFPALSLEVTADAFPLD